MHVLDSSQQYIAPQSFLHSEKGDFAKRRQCASSARHARNVQDLFSTHSGARWLPNTAVPQRRFFAEMSMTIRENHVRLLVFSLTRSCKFRCSGSVQTVVDLLFCSAQKRDDGTIEAQRTRITHSSQSQHRVLDHQNIQTPCRSDPNI